MSIRDDAARLVELCEQASPDVWLDVLEAAQDDLAIALHARGLIVEIRFGSRCHVRLGLTPLGRVIHPLSGHDPMDVVVAGDAEDVAAFLLGRLSLGDAQARGLLSIRPGAPVDRLEPVRAVVAAGLRALLSERAVFVPAIGLASRLRRLSMLPAEWTAVALSKLGPAVVAGVVALGAATPATAVEAGGRSYDTQPAIAAAPSAVAPTARPAEAAVAAPSTSHVSSRPTSEGSRAPADSASGTMSLSASFERTDRSFETNVHGEAIDRREDAPYWLELRCDTTVRAAVCDALARLPRPGT